MDQKNTRPNEVKKELFEAPEAEVVVLGTEDVLSASGGFDGEMDIFGGL